MSHKKFKFAVVLSGCGFLDGSEIQEAVMTLLAVSRLGGEVQCFAPNVNQHHATDHVSGKATQETRNVLVESARIARGKIKPLSSFKASDFDAIFFPGGYGAALNLSTFAIDGENCKINADVERAVKAMHQAKKPIGALCIAPVILAKLLGKVTLTVGQDKFIAGKLEKLGTTVQSTTHGEVVIDKENGVVTSPCYMLEASVAQIADGAYNMVKAVIELIEKS